MVTQPLITYDIFEEAFRHLVGQESGEFSDIVDRWAMQFGVKQNAFTSRAVLNGYFRQCLDLYDGIRLGEFGVTIYEREFESTTQFNFLLFPSGAFGCWLWNSFGDKILFIQDEYDPLTLIFKLKQALFAMDEITFVGPISLSNFWLGKHEFRSSESYPVGDPMFWNQVFQINQISKWVAEKKLYPFRQAGAYVDHGIGPRSCTICNKPCRPMVTSVLEAVVGDSEIWPDRFYADYEEDEKIFGSFALCDDCRVICPTCGMNRITLSIEVKLEKLRALYADQDIRVTFSPGVCQCYYPYSDD
jgi:hypothetical protein